MPTNRRELVLGAAAVGALAGRAGAQPAGPLANDAIRRVLAARIDQQKQGVGLVVGVTSPEGRRVVGHGRLAKDAARTPGGDTVFEIGSLTKVFTGLIFADMVLRGEIGLEDPLARHLPGVKLPERDDRVITLLDLATHTAGLPRFPTNPKLAPDAPKDVFEWYLGTIGYGEADLFAFLASFPLPRAPGARWEYSNICTALLGMALCRRAGLDYASLLAKRITRPLGMASTAIQPTAAMSRRMASGHELDLRPAPRWDMGALLPAGGALSTAGDLLTFLGAVMPGARSPVAEANALALRTRRPATAAGYEQAIGWEIVPIAGGGLPWKTGLTRGCSAAMTYDPERRTGVVLLANSDRQAPDIARHVLRPAAPLARAFVAVEVRPELMAAYAGRYRLGGFTVDVERLGSGLGARVAGSPLTALTAIGEASFLTAQGNAELTFGRSADGAVATAMLKPEGGAALTLQRAP